MCKQLRIRWLLVVCLVILGGQHSVTFAQENPWFTEVKLLYGKEDTLIHPSPQYKYDQPGVAVVRGVAIAESLDVYGEMMLTNIIWKRSGRTYHQPQANMTVNSRWKPITYGLITWFIEGGGGVGIATSSPSENTLGGNPTGILTYGSGFKVKIDKTKYAIVQYKFIHTSSILGRDSGINTNCLMLGIGW